MRFRAPEDRSWDHPAIPSPAHAGRRPERPESWPGRFPSVGDPLKPAVTRLIVLSSAASQLSQFISGACAVEEIVWAGRRQFLSAPTHKLEDYAHRGLHSLRTGRQRRDSRVIRTSLGQIREMFSINIMSTRLIGGAARSPKPICKLGEVAAGDENVSQRLLLFRIRQKCRRRDCASLNTSRDSVIRAQG
jgi:hypothetical protein